MSAPEKMRTSDGLEVVTHLDPNGKRVIKSFHVRLYEELEELSVVELRVIAEEGREILLDRLFAARPQVPGVVTVQRPPVAREGGPIPVDRTPFRHKPLAKSTVERKAAEDQDGRKLIATGEYAYGIEVVRGEKKGEVYYTIRPKPGMHPTAGVTHRVLAAFHEFGTKHMPKRPAWGIVLRAIKEALRKRRKKLTAEAMRKMMRKVG